MVNEQRKSLLEIEFELLIQDLKNSGLVVNENEENIETDKIIDVYIRKKREKRGIKSLKVNVLYFLRWDKTNKFRLVRMILTSLKLLPYKFIHVFTSSFSIPHTPEEPYLVHLYSLDCSTENMLLLFSSILIFHQN